MFLNTVIITLAVSILAGYTFIPVLTKLKYGQVVRTDGPSSHLRKTGTPTMGGIIFIFASLIGFLSMIDKIDRASGFIMLGFMAFAPIGMYDDWLKIKMKNTDGLSAKYKLLFQFFVASFLTLISYSFIQTIHIPFIGNVGYSIYFAPVIIIMYIATVNAVNFTDGIDGLCSSVTFIISVLLTLATGNPSVRQVILLISASLVGFLFFNFNPAKVFMGDAGSFAIGGYIATVALVLGLPFYIPIFGIIYVIEIVSVMIQVPYFKKTGKRFFKMTPIHHHFEMSGWSEWRIVLIFSLISTIMTILTLFLVRLF